MNSHDRAFDSLYEIFTSCVAAADSDTVDHFVELELSFSQVKTLFVLVQADAPLPIHAVADRIRLSVAATGRAVDLLVASGLVERRENPADRRVKHVTITRAGREATDTHIEHKRAALRAQVAQLDAADADRLHQALVPMLVHTPLDHSPLEQELSV